MNKIALLTLYGNGNYGNKLQHYGLQCFLEKFGYNVETIISINENKIVFKFKRILKIILKKRYRYFYLNFDNYMKYSNNVFFEFGKSKDSNNYDYFVVGSDQVWNTNFDTFTDAFLLKKINANKRISFSSSFGIDKLPEEYHELFKTELSKFKAISVREDSGKKIVEDLTGRKDVEVLVDPTMLLTSEEWDKVSKKPKNLKSKKYILNYFLGNLSEERKNEINRIAKENDCDVINILEKNDPMYVSGPSEFLWLEKNAFLICTDSFHSSVFAILYNRPFVVFDREDNNANMGSRIDTLLSKFELKDRRYNGKEITKENLNHDYSKAYEILENEREKSDKFLRNALDIK